MKQRQTEWIKTFKLEVQREKFKHVYRSTVHFCDWLESLGFLDEKSQLNILDIGTGMGANIYYMAQRYPMMNFCGIELNKILVEEGNKILTNNNISNCSLRQGDIYNLPKETKDKYDGIVSILTISCLPEYKIALKNHMLLNPQWIAIVAPLYDGYVECTTQVHYYSEQNKEKVNKEVFYNVYSMQLIKDLFDKHGYCKFHYTPFEIDIDIDKPKGGGMGTYTEKMENGRRIQISGPLLMPWYFVVASK